ncbi:MarR family winged helix-turn-helix transcriptional regulator [Shewanella algae]|uniref:MarR family winged helix-turn-helix transcriptional regulator n=1 Tax=Shewanella algae TaxID=38313 RepID=UPI001183E692|nr:MarR family transcriptional regulator [Shewanella algae]MBC8796287.1 MarR family transcriptional regulator [Shewanella algae]MBO2620334.1 MarR family transcriptional regulator [Shewanella algae]MBO2624488.1 MarR family transcriptional regulator [Shewanella algae]MBO2662457.1 MarR family transcriptional regulator [Shewanella algae]MBO2696388.1 MarR family transcriptional regulator [Shewanella algae]
MKQQQRQDSLQQLINHAIIEFYERLSSWEQSVVRDQGASLAQIHTVEILGAHGPMKMKELAEKLGITTGTLTVQVERLVKAGLAERQPLENDRRAIQVSLTEKGEQMFKEHDALHLQLTREMTAKFSDAELEQLLGFFNRLNSEF